MRKVLSIVLVLALVLGSTAFTFGAVPSDVSGTKYEDAVNVLMELDVISGYPDGSYKPAGIVTRGEMAKIIVCALGLEDYAAGSSSFSDMAGHWSDKYVAYAVSLGIINGYPDGTFKADNTVTYDEAAKMLVAALGYTEAGLIGTWPANWVTKAKTLGILDGIKTAGATGANRGDIALMAFQTLNKDIGKVNNDGDWNPAIPADTMLIRLDAKLYDPGADAYDSTLVVTAGAAFVVTGEEDSVISLKELQGALITAYANDDDEIIAVKEVKSQFYTGKVDGPGVAPGAVLAAGNKIGDYEIRNAAAIPGAAFRTVTFANGVDGAAVNAVNYVDNQEVTIACDISGKYITKIYSVSSWVVDAAFVFDTGDLEDDNIKGNVFETDNNDEIDEDSFALFGVDSLSDIKKGNVIYVYDNGAKVTRIDVGTEIVSGTVTKISSAAPPKITVGGKAYEISTAPGNDGADWALVDLKDEVEFSLGYDGKVYAVEIVDSEADTYAILLETDDGVPGLSGKDGVAKLLLVDGTDKIFTVDGDLVVAGVVAADGIWNPAYKNTLKAGTFVKYGLNKDGEIDALTIYPTAPIVAGAVVADTEVTSKGYFDSKAVASDVIVFTFDGASATATAADLADEENYGITTLSQIKGNKYDDVVYMYDDDAKQIILMLIFGEGSSDDKIYGLVTGWFNTVDSSTDMMVTVLVDGAEKEYELTSAGKADILAGGFNEDLLQMLKFTAAGQVSGTVEVDAHGVGEATKADWVVAGGVITNPGGAYDKGVIKVGVAAAEHTIDSDAIAYKWDAVEGEFTKKAVSKSNLADGVTVHLYDLDEDGVIDIVLYW